MHSKVIFSFLAKPMTSDGSSFSRLLVAIPGSSQQLALALAARVGPREEKGASSPEPKGKLN